jgi:hypothetical protein
MIDGYSLGHWIATRVISLGTAIILIAVLVGVGVGLLHCFFTSGGVLW